MKVAILSDIHGNQYALKEVLEEAKYNNIEKLLLLGDYVGYYYGALEVLGLLSDWKSSAIIGNHDEMLFHARTENEYLTEITRRYGHGHEVAIKTLDNQQLKYLESLGQTKSLVINNWSILLCHGSPWDPIEYVYPDATDDTLRKFARYQYDFIFFGHTHYSTQFKREGQKIINPGSVGQSRQKGGCAYWGMLECDSGIYNQMCTKYPTDRLKHEVKRLDPYLKYNYEVLDR